jgi:hypothetical protein
MEIKPAGSNRRLGCAGEDPTEEMAPKMDGRMRRRAIRRLRLAGQSFLKKLWR